MSKKLDIYDRYFLRNEHFYFRPNLTIDFHQKSAEMGYGFKTILQEYNAFNSYFLKYITSQLFNTKKGGLQFLFERH